MFRVTTTGVLNDEDEVLVLVLGAGPRGPAVGCHCDEEAAVDAADACAIRCNGA